MVVSGQTTFHEDVRLMGSDARLVVGNDVLIQTTVPLTVGFHGYPATTQGTIARFYGQNNKRMCFQDLFNVTDGDTYPHQAM